MNNKAQAAQYAIAFMLAVVCIILALAWAFPLNELTNSARNETFNGGEIGSGMNCTSNLISDFTNAGCLTADLMQGYFIGSVLAIAGVVVAARIIFQ